jgi:hypothetical protein
MRGEILRRRLRQIRAIEARERLLEEALRETATIRIQVPSVVWICEHGIQAWFRGVVARCRVQAMLADRDRERTAAAIRIQVFESSNFLPSRFARPGFVGRWHGGGGGRWNLRARKKRVVVESDALCSFRSATSCLIFYTPLIQCWFRDWLLRRERVAAIAREEKRREEERRREEALHRVLVTASATRIQVGISLPRVFSLLA